MASYTPPTEDLPIFDSLVFQSDDIPLTVKQGKKLFLRYPNAQGTENLQAINVGGIATFTTGNNGNAIVINTTSGYTNNGIVMNNSGINQNLNPSVNNMNSINMNQDASLNFGTDNNAIKFNGFNSNINEILSQYVNSSGSYVWEFISTTTSTLLSINPTTGMTISPPIFSTYTIPLLDDSSTRIPTTEWVQDLVASIPSVIPVNLPNINSLTITPSGTGSPSNSGIINQYNSGAFKSKSSGNTTPYGLSGLYTTSIPISISFLPDVPAVPTITISTEFRINIFFYNLSLGTYGQTSFNLILFPQTLDSGASLANWGTPTSTIYNINNKINNDASFIMTSQPTYAPNGRQYWTYNQVFSGVSGANGYLQGESMGGGLYVVRFYPIFNTPVNYSMTCEILNSNGVNTSNTGINIDM